jgi:hypothetical protein
MRDPTPKLVAALIETINAFQTAVRSRFSTSINGLGSRSVFRQDQMIEKRSSDSTTPSANAQDVEHSLTPTGGVHGLKHPA